MLDEVDLVQLALVVLLQALHVDPTALIGLPVIALDNIQSNLPFFNLPLLPGHQSITTVEELPATGKSEAKKAPRLFSRSRNHNYSRAQQDYLDPSHQNHPLCNMHLSANPSSFKVTGRTARNRRISRPVASCTSNDLGARRIGRKVHVVKWVGLVRIH